MRRALCCALLTLLAQVTLVKSADRRTVPSRLTIVLDFQGPRSDRSVAEMEREVEGIMKSSGLSFDWRTRSQAAGQSFENLVLVRFKGKCIMEPIGYLYDERGPLAFTYSTEGAVQPFSEVECDKVTAHMRPAMAGEDFAHGDLLLGRALGRVVAHELFHVLSQSKHHDHEGIEKAEFSGKDLISADFAHK